MHMSKMLVPIAVLVETRMRDEAKKLHWHENLSWVKKLATQNKPKSRKGVEFCAGR